MSHGVGDVSEAKVLRVKDPFANCSVTREHIYFPGLPILGYSIPTWHIGPRHPTLYFDTSGDGNLLCPKQSPLGSISYISGKPILCNTENVPVCCLSVCPTICLSVGLSVCHLGLATQNVSVPSCTLWERKAGDTTSRIPGLVPLRAVAVAC